MQTRIRSTEKKRVFVISTVMVLALMTFILVVAASSFIYIHWTAYRIAAHHIDYAEVEPPVIMSLAALAVFAISVKKQNQRFLYKYLAIVSLILFIGSIITALFSIHAYCPVCNYVDDDKWYPILYQLFKGTVYEPI
ncbi:MAG: hypothetical protein K5868_08875 [Lachnospiraceae bacterium]|nr:hypothetical protein [Lachnospiraceae bacterium]